MFTITATPLYKRIITDIHRLGRTGRAGKNGIGILVLGGKGEERTVVGQELKGLNIKVSEDQSGNHLLI
jgi:superfamily II DNA/RNA helicase